MPSRATSSNPWTGLQAGDFKNNPLMQVRIVYIAFVRGLFAAAPPGQYHWSPGEESEIFVSDENPIPATEIGKRPCISFTRGPVQFYSLGLDDMLGYNFQTGTKKKGVLIPGVMSINCCSRNQLESENLAWIIAEHIWLLRERMMQFGFFEIGRQPQISAPSPAGSLVSNDGGKETYCTSVSSPFQFPRTSQFTPLNKTILQNIEMQLGVDIQQLRSNGYPASPHGTEFPVQVHTCPPTSYAPHASDTRGRTPDPAGELPPPPPTVPHPLNPSVRVTLRSANPYKPGIRPASLGGRAIPIADQCVEESGSKVISSTTKV